MMVVAVPIKRMLAFSAPSLPCGLAFVSLAAGSESGKVSSSRVGGNGLVGSKVMLCFASGDDIVGRCSSVNAESGGYLCYNQNKNRDIALDFAQVLPQSSRHLAGHSQISSYINPHCIGKHLKSVYRCTNTGNRYVVIATALLVESISFWYRSMLFARHESRCMESTQCPRTPLGLF